MPLYQKPDEKMKILNVGWTCDFVDAEAGQTLQQNRNRITATLGLVVHAAGDIMPHP